MRCLKITTPGRENINTAQTYLKTGSRTKAVYYYRKAIEKVPVGKGLTTGILENMLKTVGKTEVVRWCDETIIKKPNSRPANLMLFRMARRAGEHNKALGHIDTLLIKTLPNGPAWGDYMMKKCNTLIMAYMKTSDRMYLVNGITEFEKILEFQPDNATVLNNLAYLLANPIHTRYGHDLYLWLDFEAYYLLKGL